MSDGSSIEWCDTTWNPILGCKRVSPGCDQCYAITQARIRAGNPSPKVAAAFAGLTERTEAGIDWTGQINLLPERLHQPFGWRKPRKVFVNSLSDLFHEDVPDAYIASIFVVMAATPQHTYQILTKRHGRMRSLLNSDAFRVMCFTAAALRNLDLESVAWPLPNVWLGVSVEDQKWADIRIPALIETPAAIRWVSAEPLLGPVDLFGQPDEGCEAAGPAISHHGYATPVGYGTGTEWDCDHQPGIDWLVVGGESGAGARPMHPSWVRSIRDQCVTADVPFLFKQRGAWTWERRSGEPEPRVYVSEADGRTADEQTAIAALGSWAGVRRVGKKAAGRELDGRTWDEFPRTEAVPA